MRQLTDCVTYLNTRSTCRKTFIFWCFLSTSSWTRATPIRASTLFSEIVSSRCMYPKGDRSIEWAYSTDPAYACEPNLWKKEHEVSVRRRLLEDLAVSGRRRRAGCLGSRFRLSSSEESSIRRRRIYQQSKERNVSVSLQ